MTRRSPGQLPDDRAIAHLLALGHAALGVAEPVRWRNSWPSYVPEVDAFFREAAQAPWSRPDYDPVQCGRLIDDPATMAGADLDQLCQLLTWMVRGERFCDGHWASLIGNGHLQRWLQRLDELARQG